MVRAITTIVCSLLLLLSFSCSREDTGPQETIPDSGIVTFTAMTGQGETRSSQEGSFETGDAIGVFAIEPKTGVYWAVNNKYTYDGQKFKPETEADNIIVTVGTDFDFYVYYPIGIYIFYRLCPKNIFLLNKQRITLSNNTGYQHVVQIIRFL